MILLGNTGLLSRLLFVGEETQRRGQDIVLRFLLPNVLPCRTCSLKTTNLHSRVPQTHTQVQAGPQIHITDDMHSICLKSHICFVLVRVRRTNQQETRILTHRHRFMPVCICMHKHAPPCKVYHSAEIVAWFGETMICVKHLKKIKHLNC